MYVRMPVRRGVRDLAACKLGKDRTASEGNCAARQVLSATLVSWFSCLLTKQPTNQSNICSSVYTFRYICNCKAGAVSLDTFKIKKKRYIKNMRVLEF